MSLRLNYRFFVQHKHLRCEIETLGLIALISALAGCGNPDLKSAKIGDNAGTVAETPTEQSQASSNAANRGDDEKAAPEIQDILSENAQILSLSLSPADVFCPQGFQYNAATLLCESATEAAGPFTNSMVSKCRIFGGGSACPDDNWEVGFARNIRGTGVCAPGATRVQATGLCNEGDSSFGPFSKEHVSKCKSARGGSECEGMKWSKELAERTLPGFVVQDKFTFPFSSAALESYLEAPRSFASCRDGCNRKHAAADLYGEVGRPIYAVAAGTVIDFYAFYLGTYALVVDHGEFIVRYGEITSRLGAGIQVGSKVARGQRIAQVGNLDGLSINMLHFERFSGSKNGSLTNATAPFFRRSDLVNPTDDLIKWKYPK